MMQHAPPRWLERALLWCLSQRDRETISGDLLEEYREEQRPHLGSFGAGVWYLREWASFLSVRSFGGSPGRVWLTWMSLFTAAAGGWLAVMENILKHPGYAARATIDCSLAVYSLATLLCLMLRSRSVFRKLVLTGALGAVAFGLLAIHRILDSPHFEGFALVIGCALTTHGVLALVVLFRAGRETI